MQPKVPRKVPVKVTTETRPTFREASQKEAYTSLVNRHRSLEADHKRVLTQRDALQATVEQFRQRKARDEANVIRMAKLEAERRQACSDLRKEQEANAKLESLFREKEAAHKVRESEREKELLTKDAEVAALRLRIEELERAERTGSEARYLHIPLKDNRLHGSPSITSTLDETQECFLDPDREIGCLHMDFRFKGVLEEMTIRKTPRLVRGQKS